MRPKFFTTIKSYSKKDFISDFTAGIIVAIVALPLSIALAIASGVTPEKGLHTVIVAGFIISFLGGSRVQIGGPTGAFMIIVYGIVMKFGIDRLIMATIMAGVIMFLMGLFKLGGAIKFIPHTITTGFTSGIAVIIFSSQINDFLGMNLSDLPPVFMDKWLVLLSNLAKIDILTLGIGVLALVIIIFWSKTSIRIPGTLVAIVVTTLIVQLAHLNIMTIGSKFGQLSSDIPMPYFPMELFNFSEIRLLIAPAFTIAMLGAIESLMSAVVADGMIGGRHRSNTELMAQGLANIGSGLFGGIPATGAIARTVTNVNNGGRTPVAGMVHAVTMLVIMVAFMPYAQMIPLCSLAAVLIVVAYNMSGWREFYELLKSPRSDVAVLLFTFFITIFVDLVVAIGVGMVLASLLFMKRMADVSSIYALTRDHLEEDDGFTPTFDDSMLKNIPNDIEVFEINGAMFFGVVDKFLDVITNVKSDTRLIILRMRNVPDIDVTAVYAIRRFIDNCKKFGIQIVVSGLRSRPYDVLYKAGIIDEIGSDNIFELFEHALEASKH